jgi:hypothetical protein
VLLSSVCRRYCMQVVGGLVSSALAAALQCSRHWAGQAAGTALLLCFGKVQTYCCRQHIQ